MVHLAVYNSIACLYYRLDNLLQNNSLIQIQGTFCKSEKRPYEKDQCEDSPYYCTDTICTFPLILFDWKIPKGINIVFVHFYLIN